ncbi:restriction endonuclease subunit S [Gordonia amicalis]|uniref:restriction endonuclease subunit S n=1 Tax=Gordonia amicalis TaxID=89053 RepID=UPI0015F62586|nr:restriction endonuclease subunit S [Gordonia amicalis]MBA5845549.1 restriction endonuclease subunit S [Gordonia amicalis]UOG21958.1 restriction endonuclease subunit S [Gordonia amicalis]
MQIDVTSWGDFIVGDIFDILSGKGVTRTEIALHPGDLPAIQSAVENNGCLGYIDRSYCEDKEYVIVDVPCLTVARSGSVGFISYQPSSFVVGDSAKALIPRLTLTENQLLYLKVILTALRGKYSYGDKVTTERYRAESIRLPIASDGSPDLEYMEKYMGSVLSEVRTRIELLMSLRPD